MRSTCARALSPPKPTANATVHPCDAPGMLDGAGDGTGNVAFDELGTVAEGRGVGFRDVVSRQRVGDRAADERVLRG